jgi:AmmeMemoRadiSam system protein B
VAGQFYEGSGDALRAELEAAYREARGPGEVPRVAPGWSGRLLGLVSPHAGYVYSAPMAAYGFLALAREGTPERCVVIGPNHGRGSRVSAIQTRGAWQTPLGEARIDEALAARIATAVPWLEEGPAPFREEHSLEVQIPFLQHLYGPTFAFVPVMMLEQDLSTARELGLALGRILQGQQAVIIASTDMTHGEARQVAKAQDRLLIEKLEALDPEGLIRERERRNITMCGYGPTAAMLFAAKALGATRAEVFRYGDSGEAHAMREVVGYLSAGVYR